MGAGLASGERHSAASASHQKSEMRAAQSEADWRAGGLNPTHAAPPAAYPTGAQVSPTSSDCSDQSAEVIPLLTPLDRSVSGLESFPRYWAAR